MAMFNTKEIFDEETKKYHDGLICNGCNTEIQKWEKPKHRNSCHKAIPTRPRKMSAKEKEKFNYFNY